MSPLYTSSTAPLRDAAFPLPLFPQDNARQARSTTAEIRYLRFPILDVSVASGILALFVALLVPALNSHDLSLPSAMRSLVDYLRLARASATSQGIHFRVTFQPQAYAIEQLQDQDGNEIWEPDAKRPVWRVTLPSTVAVGTGAGTVIEFDARGLIASASSEGTTGSVTVELKDSQTEKSEMIEILSSGKVQRL